MAGTQSQPVAALSERLVRGNSAAEGHVYTSRPSDVSLRGVKWYALPNCHCEAPRGPWQSRSTRWDNRKAPAKTQLPARDCTPRALPRASRSGRHVGLWPPRNDNSGAITVLSSAGTNRKRCAGSGMPLPYNARLAVLRNFPFSILHFPFAPCLAPAICTAFHNKKLPHPGGCGSRSVFLTC